MQRLSFGALHHPLSCLGIHLDRSVENDFILLFCLCKSWSGSTVNELRIQCPTISKLAVWRSSKLAFKVMMLRDMALLTAGPTPGPGTSSQPWSGVLITTSSHLYSYSSPIESSLLPSHLNPALPLRSNSSPLI